MYRVERENRYWPIESGNFTTFFRTLSEELSTCFCAQTQVGVHAECLDYQMQLLGLVMSSTSFKRYNIVGTSGCGKSTFAKTLAEKCSAQYIELDRLHHKANWQTASDEELKQALERALSETPWVLDGNYHKTMHVKWAREICVVWLDFSFARVLGRALKRAIHRSWTGVELWPGTNNRETFRALLFSKNSIVLWTLQTFYPNRRMYTALMQQPPHPHVHFIRLRSPREAQQWLEQLG